MNLVTLFYEMALKRTCICIMMQSLNSKDKITKRGMESSPPPGAHLN